MAKIDLKLDGRDIGVEDHDLSLVTGVDRVKQRLLVGQRLFRGEDYLYPESGIPYWTQILTDQPRTSTIEAIFRQDILNDGEIDSITSFSMSDERATRSLTITYKAVSSEGVVNVDEVFP